jgi:putative peptidoglycan lipid II flippase
MQYSPMLGLRDPGVHEVGRLMLPRVAGLAAVQVNFLVNTILASGLAAGSLAALNYAWLLMLLPQGIFAQSIATAAFPTFSAQAARQQRSEMRSTLSATLRAVLYLTIPAAAGLLVLRRPLIEIIFQRGAFTAGSTEMVAWALAFYVLGLPAHALVEIVVRAFYAMHDTKTPVVVGVAAMALNVFLSLAFIAAFESGGLMPHGGLAFSNSIATTIEMAVLLFLIRRRLNGLEGRQMGRSLARISVSAAALAAVAGGLAWSLSARSAWLVAALAVGSGGLVYVALSLVLGSPEPRAVWRMVRSRR